MRQTLHSLSVSSTLALKDLWHDWKITFCLIVSLFSVIAPLLLLFGLKSGIIAAMEEEFLQDPLKREIRILGHQTHDLAWFEQLSSHDESVFIMPKTRILNAQVDLLKDSKSFLRRVEILPTKAGDPVLTGYSEFPVSMDQIVISHTVGQALNVQQGDQLMLGITRQFQGMRQLGRYRVKVIGVLPESAFLRNAVFVDFKLLLAVDDFKDEHAVAVFGISEGKKREVRESFASARVFAKSLQGVAVLADFIRQTGVEVKTHARDIEMIQQTEKVLSFIIKVIASVAVLGGTVSLAGFLIANLDRKRQHIATLKLLGFTATSVVLYPIIQSFVIASLGFLLASGGYYLGAVELDRVLGHSMQEQNFICQLSSQQMLGAYLLTVLVALTASIIGGFRAIKVEPAEIFRQQ